MKFTEVEEQYTPIFGEIWAVLRLTYNDDGAMIWLNSRNKNLDMQRPIDLINKGQGLEVREVAYALEAGGGG